MNPFLIRFWEVMLLMSAGYCTADGFSPQTVPLHSEQPRFENRQTPNHGIHGVPVVSTQKVPHSWRHCVHQVVITEVVQTVQQQAEKPVNVEFSLDSSDLSPVGPAT